jgi:hypothetical protein
VLGTSCFGNTLAKSLDSCDELWTRFAPAITDIITKHPKPVASCMILLNMDVEMVFDVLLTYTTLPIEESNDVA